MWPQHSAKAVLSPGPQAVASRQAAPHARLPQAAQPSAGPLVRDPLHAPLPLQGAEGPPRQPDRHDQEPGQLPSNFRKEVGAWLFRLLNKESFEYVAFVVSWWPCQTAAVA